MRSKTELISAIQIPWICSPLADVITTAPLVEMPQILACTFGGPLQPAIIEHARTALQPGRNRTLLEARILDRKLAGPLHRRRLFLLCLSDGRYRRTKEGEKPEGAPHNNSR